ncbi:MAG: response regulator [Acidobacteriia bacterium]|nr:response regulator [Terriglobia bacterium]
MFSPSKHQVLLVDDDQSIRESITLLLISSGYDVSTAEDGFTALQQLRRTLPDLIVSDLNMPQMSGYELLSVVRRRFPQIMTVAMSGAYRGDAVPAGVIADGFFAKGSSLKNLLAMIAGLVRTSHDRVNAHQMESAPAWIPRNGNDSHGAPYVVVMCSECLRAFQLPVVEETTGAVLETPCRFCPNTNRYIIEPLGAQVQQLSV